MNISSSFLVTLIQFIIVLGLLLFSHEFGHFIVARLLKIEVEEFGFGFPPRLVKLFTLSGTEFTLNWIPFGAFVRIKGENDPDVPGGMAASNPWKRLAVLLGGPGMNILVGILLFSVLFMRLGVPDTSVVQVMDVTANTPAASAGLMAGDVITQVNNTPITTMENLQSAISSNLDKSTQITFLRDGKSTTVDLVPRSNPPQGQGAIGITMGYPYKPVSWGQAVPTAVQATYEQAYQLVMLPVRLIEGSIPASQARVVGPVGIFDMYQQAVQMDSQAGSSSGSTPSSQTPEINVLYLISTISVALGFTNLLPIPALDGGRILFVLPEILLRRKVPAKYENLIHLIGFAALLLFISYVTLQDLVNPVVLP